jgi:hypothetical protein
MQPGHVVPSIYHRPKVVPILDYGFCILDYGFIGASEEAGNRSDMAIRKFQEVLTNSEFSIQNPESCIFGHEIV